MNGIGRRWCAVLALAVCVSAPCFAKTLAVIVDKSNTLAGMTVADLSKMFKFDSRKWPDGRDVVLVLPGPATPEMQILVEKLYHMPPGEVKNLLANHKNVVIVNSEEQMLKSVETIPGAVGLVDVYDITSRINILRIDGKLPLEQGYLLHSGQ
jgi:hypothetical protein